MRITFARPFVLNHSATGACRFRNRFSETTALRFFNCDNLYGVHLVGTFQRQNRVCRHICACDAGIETVAARAAAERSPARSRPQALTVDRPRSAASVANPKPQ